MLAASPSAPADRPLYPEERPGRTVSLPLAGGVSRDLRLDTLRGLMLVAIAINHLDTELRVFTDYVFGFVSTAEGFVFLSGLVAGLVYTRRSANSSPVELQQKARRRAWEIYLFHLSGFVTAFIGLQLLTLFTHVAAPTAPALFFQEPVTALLLGSSLLFQPGLLDILPMYCGFMRVLPAMLATLRKGHWGRLFAVSGGLWLLSQFGLRDHLERSLQNLLPINLGVFDLLAWQFLFVYGAFFGYHWAKSPKPLLSFRPAMLVFCLLVATPLWFLIRYQPVPTGLSMDLIWSWADKTHLAPLRLVNFIVLAYLIAAVAVHRPRIFTFRPLAFLGRHSLVVFTAQATFCLFVLTQPQLFATFTGRTVTAITMVGLLFPVAWLAEMATRRRSTQPADPARSEIQPSLPWIRVRPGAPVVKHRSPWNPPARDWRSKSASSSKSTV